MANENDFSQDIERDLSTIGKEGLVKEIYKKMGELRKNPKLSDMRRWVWELIQNANDARGLDRDGKDRKVSIEIEFQLKGEDPFVEFRHNGKLFNQKHLMHLISKVSGKDREEEGNPKSAQQANMALDL